MVVMRPFTADTRVWHDRTGLPSTCTVQAPQAPMPQPYFVPLRLRMSRSTQSSGMSAGASTLADLPLTVQCVGHDCPENTRTACRLCTQRSR